VIRVTIPGLLAVDAEGAREIQIEHGPGMTVGAVLDVLAQRHPRLALRLRDETGSLRRHVNVFVDGEDVRSTGGVDTAVAPGSNLLVLPSVAGGA
jgi:molybdopterin converting factor small subunit